MKYTLTNKKRVDRAKATVLLVIFELIAIGLFGYYGIIKTTQANEYNTVEVIDKIQNFEYVNEHIGRIKPYYYTISCDDKNYHLGGSSIRNIDHSEFSDILSSAPDAKIVVDKWERIVELSIGNIIYASAENYNSDQMASRIMAIILHCIAQVIIVLVYIINMVFHRTSKDREFNKKRTKRQ